MLLKRYLLIIFVLLLVFKNSQAQFVTIPDTNFVNWLNSNGYAGCMNGNQMDTTCSLIVNATSIDCTNSNIYDLTGVNYFDSLILLSCGSNQLSSLPVLPNTLSLLYCNSNQLVSLPSLPNSITHFSCSHNLLSTLPVLPTSLYSLYCDFNQLTLLPVLPNSLCTLYCKINHLTSLPVLPSSLIYLDCSNNQITSLPNVPSSLEDLLCENNQLNMLPPLNDTMATLYIDNNPGLTCLPPIHQINYFRWDSTAIKCLPNVINIVYWVYPTIAIAPICGYFNNDSCGVYFNLNGIVYNDNILNCVIDSSEARYPNIRINLYQNTQLLQQTITNSFGQYTFDVDTGIYIYTLDSNSIYQVACPISGIHTSNLTTLDSIDYDMDFAIECKPGFDVGVTSILRTSGIFRPANFASMRIFAGDLSNYFRLHCASGVNGEIKVLLSGPISYISPLAGALTPTFSGDTLIYSIADFGTVDYDNAFGLYVQTDTTAQALQQVCFEVWVTPSGDNDSTNNHLTQCFNVVNSFDPNDKQVSPEYIEDANGEWLTYTVRFQNTGNAPANHIYILDTLSQFVDASTFKLIAYSHEPLTVLTGNAIRFNFAGINLPDSVSNEPGSHGYVQYRVRSLPGLANNTSVENTAYIYFDFNAPVVTNTATSLVHCLESRILSQTICNGESFAFNNMSLVYPGIYLDTIYNINGCDTIVYLSLNVTYQTINTIQNGNTLQVLNSGNYQWINCNTNTSIAGQSSSAFNPTANGNYAVIVTNGSCVDTSSCINFVISGVGEIASAPVKLSPNPAGEYIVLENLPINKCQIVLHDITGRNVSTIINESSTQRLNITSLSKGVYLIEISGKEVHERLYFVKE